MNYTYEVMTNFKNNLIDFFEWNNSDKIIMIKKIPIIKIETIDFKKLFSNNFSIKNEFLEKIKVKNRFFCLLMDDSNVFAVEFNNKGVSIKKSSLLVDEELDILENYYDIPTYNFEYQILKKEPASLITRLEKTKIDFLNDKISKLKIPDDNTKIKYLYLECFETYELDSKKALNRLKTTLKRKEYINNLYNFFQLLETNR